MSDQLEAGSAPEKPGTSGPGIASVVIALAMGLGICAISGLEIYLIAEHRRAKPNIQMAELVLGGLAFAGVLLGGGLAVAGLLQKRSRVAPIAGCALNALVALTAIATLLVSLAAGKH